MFKQRFDSVEQRVVISVLVSKELSNGGLIIVIKTLHQAAVHAIQVPDGRVNVVNVFLNQLQSSTFSS